jgi:hypothetical protein
MLAFDEYRQKHYRAAVDEAVRANVPGVFWTHVLLAAAHGQLGERDAARRAVRDVLALKPDFAESGRETIEKWFDPRSTGHFVEGLRKAGLEIIKASRR